MSRECFVCHAPVNEGDGAEVSLVFTSKATGEQQRREFVCCDSCADRMESRAETLLKEVPALRSITSIYDDGSRIRREREGA